VVKPATGGSSIGVFSATSPEEALQRAGLIFSKRMDTEIIIEPFLEGKEFTVIVLENKFGLPAAIMPTEIEMAYHEGRIFDFRKKYLPTNQVRYHCPARFPFETIERIQAEAKQVFSVFGMHDFARFDGWLLPGGEIAFVDLNPISGMEQNSFLFQQASRVGMSHRDLLLYILRSSCARQGIDFPKSGPGRKKKKKPVPVVFGGSTSERQVSLMSGTNVWLKLRKSDKYEPIPYLLDLENKAWKLPYALILNHTVEEILEAARGYSRDMLKSRTLSARARAELLLPPGGDELPTFAPKRMNFRDLARESGFVFLALHGGDGENGNFQKILTAMKVKYNGSGEKASRLCMDKYAVGGLIRKIKIPGLGIAEQRLLPLENIPPKRAEKIWEDLLKKLGSRTIIVKPNDDGCSTGVARLRSAEDLKAYLEYLKSGKSFIPAGVLSAHGEIIEMPMRKPSGLLFERFVATDLLRIKGNRLKHYRRSGWLEVTIGILEERGKLRAFSPSLTVAEGEVLSVEEKFQGGTGVNITPPPKSIVKPAALKKARRLAEIMAEKAGIRGYARIDAFMNISTGALSVIEVNTLPGLTPSTVFYHQALAEKPPIYPMELLEKIIRNAGY
jgi:D-alanine-D-alanine ligase-like ATP-grasp enzyme